MAWYWKFQAVGRMHYICIGYGNQLLVCSFVALNWTAYGFYSEITAIYKNLPYCNVHVFLLQLIRSIFCTLQLAPCTALYFLCTSDMGLYTLRFPHHLSCWNGCILMFLEHCAFHHGNSILFCSVLLCSIHSILFYYYSIPFYASKVILWIADSSANFHLYMSRNSAYIYIQMCWWIMKENSW